MRSRRIILTARLTVLAAVPAVDRRRRPRGRPRAGSAPEAVRGPSLWPWIRGALEQRSQAGGRGRVQDPRSRRASPRGDGPSPNPSSTCRRCMSTPPISAWSAAGSPCATARERSPSASPGEWTLKLPEDSSEPGLTRREINWPGRWGPVPPRSPAWCAPTGGTAALGPVARLVTHRRRASSAGRLGEPLLEIDDDVVSVMDGRRLAARFREVEVEVVGAVPPLAARRGRGPARGSRRRRRATLGRSWCGPSGFGPPSRPTSSRSRSSAAHRWAR